MARWLAPGCLVTDLMLTIADVPGVFMLAMARRKTSPRPVGARRDCGMRLIVGLTAMAAVLPSGCGEGNVVVDGGVLAADASSEPDGGPTGDAETPPTDAGSTDAGDAGTLDAGSDAGADNCPDVPDSDQTDTDADGVGDVCDVCPEDPDSDQTDTDEDGVGDVCDICAGDPDPDQLDGDEDGVGDVCDICPEDADPEQLDEDMNGFGDACEPPPLYCVGRYDFEGADFIFNADGTCRLVVAGLFEWISQNTVRVSSPSFDPPTFEVTFAPDCSFFTSRGFRADRLAGGRCGDGTIDGFGEVCDDGNNDDDFCAGGCNEDCTFEATGCGDGILCAPDEECDDGGPSDTCTEECTIVPCGNGTLDAGEVCDDGNVVDGDGCRADCLGLEECGDGLLDADESCDDNNLMSGDGCDMLCEVEPGCICAAPGMACRNAVDTSASYRLIWSQVTASGFTFKTYLTRSGFTDSYNASFPEDADAWQPVRVPGVTGAFHLVSGDRLLSAEGPRYYVNDNASNRGLTTTQWRLLYARTETDGERLRLQSVDDDRYLCQGRFLGSSVNELQMQAGQCAWRFEGPAGMGLCTAP